jgi:hypothetical protein
VPEFLGDPPHDGVARRLNRSGMAAAAVGPDTGPCLLADRSPCEQHAALRVEEIAGEREVIGRVVGVDADPVGHTGGAAVWIEEHDEVSHGGEPPNGG